MMIHDYNGNPRVKDNSKYIYETCIFCNKKYKSKIDKRFDICPNCEDIGEDIY